MVEHLYDIIALQINNFNSFFNICNNLQGLSGRDNILWMILASKSHLPYIWHTDCKVVVVTLYKYMYPNHVTSYYVQPYVAVHV